MAGAREGKETTHPGSEYDRAAMLSLEKEKGGFTFFRAHPRPGNTSAQLLHIARGFCAGREDSAEEERGKAT
jgi:hypothetical protein